MAIRVGILGYGNLGRGVESAIGQNSDMDLVAVATRRDPGDINVRTKGVKIVKIDELPSMKNDIDVLILCGGSATDLPKQTPVYAEMFNVVDSFDTHARIPEHYKDVDEVAKAAGKTALISCGWDPGMATLNAPEYSLPQNKSRIDVYAPFGSEEELELVVSSSQDSTVKQTYSFKTVADARDGVSIARYKLGTTVGNASVSAAKEVWNSNKKVYTITLPAVKTNNSADVFKGWKDDNGKVYASGKKVCVDKRSLHTFQAVWKEQPTGTSFKITENQRETTKYTIIGKGSVMLAHQISIRKGLYKFVIPTTVEFHNKTYKVEAIGKSAFSNSSVQKLVISQNINKLAKNSFKKSMFLKTIVINSKKINYIGTSAMKDLNKDAVIQCPKACIKTYTKLFRKAGINKNVLIKGI